MKNNFLLIYTLFCCAIFGHLHAQNEKVINHSIEFVDHIPGSTGLVPSIQASSFQIVRIDEENMMSQLGGIMHKSDPYVGFEAIIQLPFPDGTLHSYRAVENTTMSRGYADKYSEILAMDAKGIDYSDEVVKWDITPQGLHAMIMRPGKSTVYIDPLYHGETDYYIVYDRSDFIGEKSFDCSFNSDNEPFMHHGSAAESTVKSFGTCELRTYRLALAATYEYTAYHGGTKALAAAAQVTTMNRVNGVYERDMAITMVIIPNNDLIIYETTSDPYTNGNPGTMINQNQTNCDGVIGSANYDIGHVFGTDSGGLAGLGVVCSNGNKARGVTGSSNPVNDPFDIDYVAHEVGHQFGANHTFNNSCGGNRNDATAVEPGSGNTIMAYAGICAPNTSVFSDDHFSGRSLEEIHNEILSAGHTCEVTTPLGNIAPLITATNANVTVPANTPFALTATATDADGNTLTYNWEQMDNEISTQPPVSTATGGPNFRSNPSLLDSTRYLPNLVDLANGGPFTWEVLPSITRTFDFRVIVRDNAAGGGCNAHEDVTISSDGNSGPFVVTYPNLTGITWNALTSETVTWDVANTDQAPVNCSLVDIFLSVDGGATYPYTLATGTPNDGSEAINVPNVGTTTARVMVIASGGTFFDVSDNDFTIVQASFDYTLNVSPASQSVCQPNDVTYLVTIGSLDGYNDPVDLTVSGVPAGAVANFSPSTVTPAGTSALVISNTGSATPGTYTLTVNANSTTGPKTFDVQLIIGDDSPSEITLVSPANGSTGLASPINLTWNTSSDPSATYSIEISTDPGFSSIADQASGLTVASYSFTGMPSTTYYWRVSYTTDCATSPFSSVFNFTTNGCTTYSSTDVPVAIPVIGTVTSTINVPTGGTINDVNVTELIGTHTWIKNLTINLISPLGTSVTLFSQICNNQDDFDVAFDDAAASATLPCPPTDGNTYQPSGTLSAFNGEDAMGTWTLEIIDGNNSNSGSLTAWSIEICVDPVSCNNPDLPTITASHSICEGQTTILEVLSGNLNDATTWQWYEGSCGGTPAGSGTTISVSPTTTTSYFVRGEGGCVVTGSCQLVDVTVNPSYNLSEDIAICSGQIYTYPDGSIGNSTEIHTSSLTSINGCDSIIVTNLTVNPTYSSSEDISICAGNSYTYPDGTVGNTSETHTSSLVSVNGCDSIIVTNLTVNPTYNTSEDISICDGSIHIYPDGSTGISTEVHTSLLSSIDGCDSIVITNLTVSPVYNLSEDVTICVGQTYTYPDGTIGNSTESHTSNLMTSNGCDSIIVSNLTVVSSFNSTEDIAICSGQTYTYPDGTIGSATESHISNLTSTAGCDSLVTTNLTVNPTYNYSEDIAICSGQIYTYPDGSTGNSTEVHTSSLSSINGCDSIIITNLTVNPVYNIDNSIDACEGETVVYPDGFSETIVSSTAHTSLLSSINGCDSIIVTSVNMISINTNVAYNGTAYEAEQTGASYQWIDCDNANAPIDGETNQTFDPGTLTGNFAVEITIGTCTSTSACFLHDETGIEEYNSSDILIYPNPAKDFVLVKWNSDQYEKVELTDAKGSLVANYFVTSVNEINIPLLITDGVYFIRLTGPNGTIVHKLIKE